TDQLSMPLQHREDAPVVEARMKIGGSKPVVSIMRQDVDRHIVACREQEAGQFGRVVRLAEDVDRVDELVTMVAERGQTSYAPGVSEVLGEAPPGVGEAWVVQIVGIDVIARLEKCLGVESYTAADIRDPGEPV